MTQVVLRIFLFAVASFFLLQAIAGRRAGMAFSFLG